MYRMQVLLWALLCLAPAVCEGVTCKDDATQSTIVFEGEDGLDTGKLSKGKYIVHLCSTAQDRGSGQYLALHTAPEWSSSFLRTWQASAESAQFTFELDLTALQAGQVVWLLYFSPTNSWSLKTGRELTLRDSGVSQAFLPDLDSILGNPGTGFTYLNKSNTASWKVPDIPSERGWLDATWWNIALNNGENEADNLSSQFLDRLDAALGEYVQKGKQVYIRFWYTQVNATWPSTGANPSTDRMKKHQEQVATIMRKNIAAISGINAGMIGHYGEWHTSGFGEINAIPYGSTLETLSQSNAIIADQYKQILDKWIELFPSPSDPPIQIRRRFHKELLVRDNSFAKRVHYHHDCALSSPNDVGSFQSPGERTVEYDGKTFVLTGTDERDAMVGDESATVVGETCWNIPENLRLGCTAALTEFPLYKYIALNINWYDPFIESWKQEGCYDFIGAQLGYRWLLRSFAFEFSQSSKTLVMDLSVENIGWSVSLNDKKVFLEFSSPSASTFAVRLDTHPAWVGTQDWQPGTPVKMRLEGVALGGLIPDMPVEVSYETRIVIVESMCSGIEFTSSSNCPSPNLATRLANKQDTTFTFNAATGRNVFKTLPLVVQATPIQTSSPTMQPSKDETRSPTISPTNSPTESDETSSSPTNSPTVRHETLSPTMSPSKGSTRSPTRTPTDSPLQSGQTKTPTTAPSTSTDAPVGSDRTTSPTPSEEDVVTSTKGPTTTKEDTSSASYSRCKLKMMVAIIFLEWRRV